MRYFLFLLFFLVILVNADEQSYTLAPKLEQVQKKSHLSYDGLLSVFGKFGFNATHYQPLQGYYPTDSYATLMSQGNLQYTLKDSLTFKVGIAANGVILDSTKWQNNQTLFAPTISDYIGFYQGYSGLNSSALQHNIILHNAYFNFKNKHFNFKIGRYELKDFNWFSDYNQGLEIHYSIANFNLFGLFSDARASVSSNWFYDYGRYYTQNHRLFIAGVSYKTPQIKMQTTIYFAPNYYVAPEIEASYYYHLDKNWSAKTQAIALFVFHHPLDQENDLVAFGLPLQSHAQTLFIDQNFFYKDILGFGFGVYKNFGNANGRIGVYGNPLSIDVWEGSLYDSGALSDLVSPDALSAIAQINYHYHWLDLCLQGRYTTSPRSQEHTLTLFLDSQINTNLTLCLKLQYFQDTTFRGYSLGGRDQLNHLITLKNPIHADRSNFIFQLNYKI